MRRWVGSTCASAFLPSLFPPLSLFLPLFSFLLFSFSPSLLSPHSVVSFLSSHTAFLIFAAVRGEVLNPNNSSNPDYDDRSYLVDFELKSWQHEPEPKTLISADMRIDQERRDWEQEQQKGKQLKV